jgi:NADPH-dependent F420 reductase
VSHLRDVQIAILGATGDFGGALALRLAADTDHETVVGSRDPSRARDAVEDYRETLADAGADASISGAGNADAADGADVVIAAVQAYHLESTVETVADRLGDDAILVSPAVGLDAHEDGFGYRPPDVGSATALAAETAPDDVPVVGAFHSIAAGSLAAIDEPLEIDTLVVGDDADARGQIADLAEELSGLRALHAGPIANAAVVESLTPLQLTVMRHNDGLHDVGVKFQ